MNTHEKVTLIEGEFSIEEGFDVLTNVFYSKIHYHEMKNFSSQLRFGKDDQTASIRIPDLNKDLEKIKEFISQLNKENKKIRITSEIHISIAGE